jgi:anti-sigma B factor antagonist
MDDTAGSRQPTVGFQVEAPDIAVVTLVGEHDLTSKEELGGVLQRAGAQRSILVDLSECTFVDSTVVALIVAACQRAWEQDGRLELVIPRDMATIQRVLKIAGLTSFLTIHETRDEALASLAAEG